MYKIIKILYRKQRISLVFCVVSVRRKISLTLAPKFKFKLDNYILLLYIFNEIFKKNSLRNIP